MFARLFATCVVLLFGGACAPAERPGGETFPYALHRADGTFPWARRPSEADARRITPAAVLGGPIEQVLMRCRMTASGGLDDCIVDDVTRADVGLENAALEAAALTAIEPTLADGTPVEGLHAQVSIVFSRTDTGVGIFPVLGDRLSPDQMEPGRFLR